MMVRLGGLGYESGGAETVRGIPKASGIAQPIVVEPLQTAPSPWVADEQPQYYTHDFDAEVVRRAFAESERAKAEAVVVVEETHTPSTWALIAAVGAGAFLLWGRKST